VFGDLELCGEEVGQRPPSKLTLGVIRIFAIPRPQIADHVRELLPRDGEPDCYVWDTSSRFRVILCMPRT
jgi:hypothetical protein